MTNERKVFTPKQGEAYNKLLELNGDNEWVLAKDVGHRITIKALEKMRVIQTIKDGGSKYVALSGVMLDPPSVLVETVSKKYDVDPLSIPGVELATVENCPELQDTIDHVANGIRDEIDREALDGVNEEIDRESIKGLRTSKPESVNKLRMLKSMVKKPDE